MCYESTINLKSFFVHAKKMNMFVLHVYNIFFMMNFKDLVIIFTVYN